MADNEAYGRVVRKGLSLKGSGVPVTRKRKHPSLVQNAEVKSGDKREGQSPASEEQHEGLGSHDTEQDVVEKVMKLEHMTPAERSFYLARLKRQKERVEKRTALTHRERMSRLNEHLSKLSEHFDIPKVGPG
eukprot:Protomagalhaensia_wolfi_Nauph_80__1373@NODE_181_length_3277_cov_316_158122_g129_i1_p6_GENE_NODE_181_length_3277_cov_316_158122_g129_i1NODE_181_length_3277_cov_316_158122_g129_i1_p6_ORF_typecomplete_len132_score13_32DUF1754/PF08555_10/2_5e08Holin_BhlA/PF10960_8/9e02Holin_BhlA/PF10960_8/0_037RA/PF00788_23/0_056DUF4427/PF14468_6/0_11_NODE_181_length_3277_cov_316_158122_g129_i127023097